MEEINHKTGQKYCNYTWPPHCHQRSNKLLPPFEYALDAFSFHCHLSTPWSLSLLQKKRLHITARCAGLCSCAAIELHSQKVHLRATQWEKCSYTDLPLPTLPCPPALPTQDFSTCNFWRFYPRSNSGKALFWLNDHQCCFHLTKTIFRLEFFACYGVGVFTVLGSHSFHRSLFKILLLGSFFCLWSAKNKVHVGLFTRFMRNSWFYAEAK